MRAQLSRLSADCDVSCAKRMAATLKSRTMTEAGGDWASGGKWITVTRGRGWEEALEVPVPVAVFVDGLVLVLVLVRLVGLGAGTRTGYAGCDAPLVQGGPPIVLNEWDGSRDGVSD
jgi:hypothetical protein